MANIVQRILIRTDLDLPMGLMAAQVAHLHMEIIRRAFREPEVKTGARSKLPEGVFKIDFSYMGGAGANLEEWIKEPYLFVHKVPGFEVLDFFHKEFLKSAVPVYEWKDTITINISPTQKKVFPSMKIGIVAGPSDSDRIKSVIGDLPLL